MVQQKQTCRKILKQTYSQKQGKSGLPQTLLSTCVCAEGWAGRVVVVVGGLITLLVLKVKEHQEAQIQFNLLHV